MTAFRGSSHAGQYLAEVFAMMAASRGQRY